jgi:outer membrane protein assembly factor BamB
MAKRTTWVLILGIALCLQTLLAAEWPQWRGPGRDGVWRETGIIAQLPSAQIALKWKVPIGSGYCGPTVAAGRVYVTDRVTTPTELERVHCFDWQTGRTIWSHAYECKYKGFGYQAGPRASMHIDEDRAYSLGATGYLVCLDAAKGTVRWQRDLREEYQIRMPNWGIAAAPVIEGDLVIVQIGGADEACLCAFDKRDGRPRWKALADVASYSAPIVVDQAGSRVLVCQTGDRIVGVDVRQGQLHWSYPLPWKSWPIGIATPVMHQDLLLVSNADQGTILLRLGLEKPTMEKVWHRKRKDAPDGKALHCLNSTPLIDGQYIYGADSRGVLRCLRLQTGEQIWEDKSAVPENNFATIHLVRNGAQTWMFNERGELIIAQLTPAGFREISRAKLIEPTREQMPGRRGGVTWSHPAFAYRHVFARNDRELVCANLTAK